MVVPPWHETQGQRVHRQASIAASVHLWRRDTYTRGSTEAVVGHHLQCFGAGDLEGILADYTADSVLCTPTGVLRGPQGMTPFFQATFAEFAKPGMSFTMQRQTFEGEVAHIIWNAETAGNVYELGTDTFVVRDSKIVAQTYAAKATPKSQAKRF